MAKVDMRKLNWSLQRMAKIISVWQRLDAADRKFLLAKFRDEYSADFWFVANEAKERQAMESRFSTAAAEQARHS